MRPGLQVGMSHSDDEPLPDRDEIDAALPADGIWMLVLPLEHVARRWMTEFMEPGEQSVGTLVTIEQVLPRPHAEVVTATATLIEVRGRRFLFEVEIRNETGELLARGRNERAVIGTSVSGQ